MARSTTITDEQILEAARIVFVRDGANATSKEIAREAGVSEGSIFRRFSTKELLFTAAVLSPTVPSWARELSDLVGTGEVRENLEHTIREMILFAQDILPLVLVAWGRKPEARISILNGSETAEIRDRRLLADYLKREVANGRLQKCNEEAVARMLFGASVNLVMDRLCLQQPLCTDEIDLFAKNIVDVLWCGIRPIYPAPSKSNGSQALIKGKSEK